VPEFGKRNPAKKLQSIRLDVATKISLDKIAKTENRTISSLLDLAVREFVEKYLRGKTQRAALRVCYACLPDTCVLQAFCALAVEESERARRDLDLPQFEFNESPPEWSRLPLDLFRGNSDLIESVNWLPIFWHVRTGGSSLRLDWVGPYLQLFVGHCIFVRADLVSCYLSEFQINSFKEFRQQAKTGEDLSLRSLTTWARCSDGTEGLGEALEQMWKDAVVGCQHGTDYHVAVCRVAPILRDLQTKDRDTLTIEPTIFSVPDRDRGIQDFRTGRINAFSGDLLHSAELLTDQRELAFLLAGPADLRIPSLNTLAGRKGLLDVAPDGDIRLNAIGGNVLAFWGRAVRWFREIVNSESDERFREVVTSIFPTFYSNLQPKMTALSDGGLPDRLEVLKSLMQTWVRWFADQTEARTFLTEGVFEGILPGALTAKDLVQQYESLCELLSPSFKMKPPSQSDLRLWPFPVFAQRGSVGCHPSQKGRQPHRVSGHSHED
jgi:hypothetical protein